MEPRAASATAPIRPPLESDDVLVGTRGRHVLVIARTDGWIYSRAAALAAAEDADRHGDTELARAIRTAVAELDEEDAS